MSYDYSVAKAPGPGPLETWDPELTEPFGTVDEVKALLAPICPELEWESFEESWFGRCSAGVHAEVQLTPEDGAQVCMITLRRVSRDEVLRVARQLGAVAIDQQTCELLRP